MVIICKWEEGSAAQRVKQLEKGGKPEGAGGAYATEEKRNICEIQ